MKLIKGILNSFPKWSSVLRAPAKGMYLYCIFVMSLKEFNRKKRYSVHRQIRREIANLDLLVFVPVAGGHHSLKDLNLLSNKSLCRFELLLGLSA